MLRIADPAPIAKKGCTEFARCLKAENAGPHAFKENPLADASLGRPAAEPLLKGALALNPEMIYRLNQPPQQLADQDKARLEHRRYKRNHR